MLKYKRGGDLARSEYLTDDWDNEYLGNAGLPQQIMSNCREDLPTVHRISTQQSSEEETNHFRRRTLRDRWFLCPRRYVMASLLSILLVIEVTRHWNLNFSLFLTILSQESKKQREYPSIGNWTLTEFDNFLRYVTTGGIFMNILGGVLIYQFSSHKFLLATVTASSILHALLPTALNHHSTAFLLIVMIGQEALSVPIFIAVLCMWKDWAPPDERTCLVSISFLGIVLEAVSSINLIAIPIKDITNLNYIVGIAGLIWALFWYNITSSTPQSDPLITEKEYLYLESKIPSNYQERTKIRDVPWKSMLKSKQVIILCLVFWKIGTSVQAIKINGMTFIILLRDELNPLFMTIPFVVIFISFFYVSSFLMDFLLKKHRSRALTIRKIFLCSGFAVNCVFLLGSIGSSSIFIRATLHTLAYSSLAFSLPGVLRYPLDISPRYVSIMGGFAFAFYTLGILLSQEYAMVVFDRHNPDLPLSIYDSIFSLIAGVVFGIWGDTEEQSWSFLASSQRRGNDYRSYPQPDDEDDVNLVPGTV